MAIKIHCHLYFFTTYCFIDILYKVKDISSNFCFVNASLMKVTFSNDYTAFIEMIIYFPFNPLI